MRELAKALDDAIEKYDVEKCVSYFSQKCEIQLPAVTLNGHTGLRKAIFFIAIKTNLSHDHGRIAL